MRPEIEQRVIVERIKAGLAAARERRVTLGRPRTLDRFSCEAEPNGTIWTQDRS